MEATFKSNESAEILRLAKSLDMAIVLFEIKMNMPRKFRDSKTDHSEVFDAINQLMSDNGVDIEDLVE